MEYRKDIAQEMLMYQTKCTRDEMLSILVSTEQKNVAFVIPLKRDDDNDDYPDRSVKTAWNICLKLIKYTFVVPCFTPEHQREV